tara:strand:+ start:325 stop:723 length:399 start_codon:yes stop_codon:yes gene_type:complete
MAETKIIGTPLAGLSYVYLSFASFTDGKLSEDEVTSACAHTVHIGKAWGHSQADVEQAWEDAWAMYNQCETNKDLKDLFVEVLDLLAKQEFFDAKQQSATVEDLERIMNADHEQHENEIFWIGRIKEAWNVA